MGSLAAAIFHSTGPTHEGGLVGPSSWAGLVTGGWGEVDEWAECQERRGGGVPEGKEGHLYASIGVFLCYMPFILAGAEAAGAQGSTLADTCRKQVGSLRKPGSGDRLRRACFLRRLGFCVYAAGPVRSRPGDGRTRIHFHKSFSDITSRLRAWQPVPPVNCLCIDNAKELR